MSSSDKGSKLYRNQGNLFAIDDNDGNDEERSGEREAGDQEPEAVNLNAWLDKADTLKSFKCFYKDKRNSERPEWVPGYLLLTKTNLYGLTNRAHLKNGMVEITVRHPLNSIIKIATKSSSPEMLSFTYGEKVYRSSSTHKIKDENETLNDDDNNNNTDENNADNNGKSNKTATAAANDYIIKGKEEEESENLQ